MVRNWTPEEIELVKKYYPKHGSKYCAMMLNREQESVKAYASNHKLKRTNFYKIWTEEEIEILKAKYPHMRTDKLSEELNCTRTEIYHRVTKLGLKKTEEFLKSPDSGIMIKGSTRGSQFRFPKGHVPANKGKKMSEEIKEKVKHTWFKKGNLPNGTLYDGAITIRLDKSGHTYKWIRISKSKWRMLQVFNWENINGPIPKDKIIVCKDGDTLNCDPDNWMMITHNEHLERNSGRKELTDKYVVTKLANRDKEMREILRQSPEIIELKRNELKLKRAINENK